MENYIVINGNKTELTEEQLKQLGLYEEVKKNPFDRVENGGKYYFIDEFGNVQPCIDDNTCGHCDIHKISNYCTDKDLIEQRALHETLNRLLWRFTHENGWSEELWDDVGISKYIIRYDVENKKFNIDYWDYTKFDGAIYFKDRETALRAIDEIVKPFMKEHPDFVW